jgi:hypothetical protein
VTQISAVNANGHHPVKIAGQLGHDFVVKQLMGEVWRD